MLYLTFETASNSVEQAASLGYATLASERDSYAGVIQGKISMETQENKIMGYSGFIIFDECYEYNENACIISNTQESAKEFMDNCGHSVSDYRIDQVTFDDIINDFGCSSGEYAMESVAFSKFRKMAIEENVKYESVEFEYDPALTIVNII